MSVEYQQPAITDLTGALSPELHLRSADLESIVDDLMAYHARFAPLFARQEQREWAAVYLRGLLVADVPRKNVEAMALRLLGAGPGAERRVRALQHFVGEGAWEDDAIVAEHQRYVDETLGEADGVLIIDGSDVPKQGTHSAGVARQWCGASGKKDNCQAAVFLGYASRKGATLLDGRLYLPAVWFTEAYQARWQACAIPAGTPFQTKHELRRIWSRGSRRVGASGPAGPSATRASETTRPCWRAWMRWGCATWRRCPATRRSGPCTIRPRASRGPLRSTGSRPRKPPARAPLRGAGGCIRTARPQCASTAVRRSSRPPPGSATVFWKAAKGPSSPTSRQCARWRCATACRPRRSGWCCAAKWTVHRTCRSSNTT